MIIEWILYSLDLIKLNTYNISNFILQVCNGIVAIYDKDFAYWDLKLENILIRVNDDGLTPKITDFGESKLKALGNITTITGLLLYMAPELYMMNLPYSKAIDMWSFGLIILELLTDWEPKLEVWGSYSLLSPGQHND
jgi:serine/threonine protein kinase